MLIGAAGAAVPSDDRMKGPFLIASTPYLEDGSVDYEALVAEAKYMDASGCTGWAPNAARYYRSRSIAGPWERMDNPCHGTDEATGLGADLTWGGQSTCIFPVRGKPDSFIAMFDRWCPTNAIDGRYVWREITFPNDGRMMILWRNDNCSE